MAINNRNFEIIALDELPPGYIKRR